MLGLKKRLARAALAGGAAVAVLIASSGCLRLDLSLEVRPDDTVGGTFTAAWSEEFLERAPEEGIEQSELDAFLEALLEGIPNAERSPYNEGGYVGQTSEFSGRPLSEFADVGGDQWGYLRIDHTDRTYQLEGRWDLRTAGFLQPEAMEDAEILISVSFPARVTDHNGELEGRTVTWRMSPGEQYELRAQAVGQNGWVWLLAGLASLIVVLALLWLWQWARMRRFSTGDRTVALAPAQTVATGHTGRRLGSPLIISAR